MTQLYLVTFTNDDGDNFDTLLEAHNTEDAVDLFLNTYGFDPDSVKPESVFKIPKTSGTRRGVIEWEDIRVGGALPGGEDRHREDSQESTLDTFVRAMKGQTS